jgi:hypothetical protein
MAIFTMDSWVSSVSGPDRWNVVDPWHMPQGGAGAHRHYSRPLMSTRKLILLALACGLAIIAAFTVQVLLIPR